MQIGLAVQLHHNHGSRHLIDNLHSLGFCASYHETRKYEMNAAAQASHSDDDVTVATTVSQPDEIRIASTLNESEDVRSRQLSARGFRQYVADNVDRNPWTIDGRISLHAMGIIETTGRETTNDDQAGGTRFQENNSPTDRNTTLSYTEEEFTSTLQRDTTNMDCVLTTLQFVVDECTKHRCDPVLTFDQPLWWKARTIIANEPESSSLKRIVLDR
jgi:hypothetical protein